MRKSFVSWVVPIELVAIFFNWENYILIEPKLINRFQPSKTFNYQIYHTKKSI